MTGGELLAAFAAGERSPVEALEECVARFDARLGVWAGAATGPLCGVPIAVKDLFDTADVETACGSRPMTGRPGRRRQTEVQPPSTASTVPVT